VTAASTGSDPVIAAAGDIACDPNDSNYNGGVGTPGNCQQMATSTLLLNGDLAGVLTLGDDQYYCGSLADFESVYDPSWGRVKTLTYPIPGNHEYISSNPDPFGRSDCSAGALGYFNYFGSSAGSPDQGYYSYNIGSWHIIALNTNDACSIISCATGSPQEQWLENDLANNPAKCVLAYWHEPRFSSQSFAAGPSSAAFWSDLYAAGAEVVLNGHAHVYERFAPQTPSGAPDPTNGIREFVVGTGGEDLSGFDSIAANSEVRDNTTFGILELTLHPGSYDWRFVPAAGGSFTDSGTASCH
jgi:hypothetical protein